MIDQVDRVVYSLNTDLDSWDMENLKYIRKISIRDSNETLSYVSEGSSGDDKGFVLTSATLPNFDKPHPPPSSIRVLEEERGGTSSRNDRPSEYSCYLMDVLLVANESVHCASSVCSADSFASAIRKGFFDMDDAKLPKENAKRRVKKSVSFMDESIQLRSTRGRRDEGLPPLQPQMTKDGRMMRRSGSFLGTMITIGGPGLKKKSDSVPTRLGDRDLSIPWNGKLVASDTLKLGYANNWAHLETYVRRLQHHSNSL